MKAKCYYCGKELNERTIKRHMKTCSLMQEVVESGLNDSGLREQLIISIRPKEDKSKYCIYLSVSGSISIRELQSFLTEVWVKDEKLNGFFKAGGHLYDESDMDKAAIWRLFEAVGSKCTYECDNMEKIELELVDSITVSNDTYTEMEIIARNIELGSPYDAKSDLAYDKKAEKNFAVGNNMVYTVCEARDEAEDGQLHAGSKANADSDDEYFDILSDEVKAMMDDMAAVIESLMVKDFSLNIEKIINSLKKDDIYFMARRLGMEKISSLSKDKLVEKFLGEYEERVAAKLNCFDSRRLELIKKFADDGVQSLDDMNITIEQLLYFRNLGMLFFTVKNQEEVLVYVPDVVKKMLEGCNDFVFRNRIKNNTYVTELFLGMMNAYGAVKIDDLGSRFEKFSIAPGTDIESILIEGEFYYFYSVVDGYYVTPYSQNAESLIKTIESCTDRKEAAVTEEELLQLGREGGVLNTKYGSFFYDSFAEMFDIDNQTLTELVESIFRDVQEIDIEEVIKMALEMVSSCDTDVVSYVESLLRDYVDSIRLWKFKGANNKEVTGKGKPVVKETEVGRNEPCPCGSGKKYKKCCGKNGKVINLF